VLSSSACQIDPFSDANRTGVAVEEAVGSGVSSVSRVGTLLFVGVAVAVGNSVGVTVAVPVGI